MTYYVFKENEREEWIQIGRRRGYENRDDAVALCRLSTDHDGDSIIFSQVTGFYMNCKDKIFEYGEESHLSDLGIK